MNVFTESFLGKMFWHLYLPSRRLQSLPFTLPPFNDSDAFFCIKLRLNLSSSLFLQPRWICSSVGDGRFSWRRKKGRTNPLLRKQCCTLMKSHQNWSSRLSSVCLLYRSSRFCNRVLLVENRTWPCFQSYGSCFVEVRVYLSLDWDSNISKDWWAKVDTSRRGIVG